MNIRKIYLIKDIYCGELKWYNYDKIRITVRKREAEKE